MKIETKEFSSDYYIGLKAENLDDAGFITKVGINQIKKFTCYANINSDGTFTLSLYIGKSKQPSTYIKNNH